MNMNVEHALVLFINDNSLKLEKENVTFQKSIMEWGFYLAMKLVEIILAEIQKRPRGILTKARF